MEMTKQGLAKICKDSGYYRTAHLNEVLYFHFKGFCEITDAISDYVNARCLWIEGNAIADIENLEKLTNLRQIYLQDNCIRSITGLENLTCLVTINLTNNFINKIEGLQHCQSLKSLIIKNNRIKKLTDFEAVLQLPLLETLDLTGNNIEDEGAIDIFEKCPSLLSLYIHQNPFIKKIKPYRKTVVGRCTLLRYLDDRPVFPDERRTTAAFMLNGIDGEREERLLMRQEEKERDERNRLAFLALVSNCKQEMSDLREQGLVCFLKFTFSSEHPFINHKTRYHNKPISLNPMTQSSTFKTTAVSAALKTTGLLKSGQEMRRRVKKSKKWKRRP